MLILVFFFDYPIDIWKVVQTFTLLATFLSLSYTAGFIAERKNRCSLCWAASVLVFAPLILPLLALRSKEPV